MPLNPEQIKITPRQEDVTRQVEVIVSYYDSGYMGVFAHITGDGTNPYISKDAQLIERYVFDVTSPFINKPLKEGK